MHKDNLIFIHKLLKAIADSIITVFIPLYILKQTNDINLSMAYLIIYSLFVIFYMLIFKKIIQKYGVIGIIIHFIPIIIAEGLLSFLEINLGVVIACAALMGLAQSLYSVPLNLIFTFGDKKTNVGKFQIASNIGKLIFTLASGLILSNIENSFWVLSIASAIFYIASIFPIIFSFKELKNNWNNTHLENNKPVRVDIVFMLFHVLFGLFQPIMDNIVPLYLYINELSFQAVTIFIVLVELLKIGMNHFSQFLVKKNKKIICISISSILFLASILVMIFVKNSIVLYIFSCTCSISFPLTFVPMFSTYCNYLRNTNNVFNGITERDFDIFSLRPALYCLSFTPLGLIACMLVGVVVVPLMLSQEKKILKKN